MSIPAAILICVLIAIIAGVLLVHRSRDRLPPLPPWGWRNIIALGALFASMVGAAIITALVWFIVIMLGSDADRLIDELVRDPKAARSEIGEALGTIYHSIANNLLALTLGLLLILISFGFAITKRRASGEWLGGKFDLTGGDDDDPPPGAAQGAQATAAAAQSAADEITEEARQ